MSKLFHVNADGVQQDIIASNIAVAVRRALDQKVLRTSRHLTIEAHISNHGEYDKVRFSYHNAVGGVIWGPRDKQGTYIRVPSHVRRAEARERLGIECQRIIDATPADAGDHTLVRVNAVSKGVAVEVYRAGFEPVKLSETGCGHVQGQEVGGCCG